MCDTENVDIVPRADQQTAQTVRHITISQN